MRACGGYNHRRALLVEHCMPILLAHIRFSCPCVIFWSSDNRLYAREDRKERKLYFECRYCQFKQAAGMFLSSLARSRVFGATCSRGCLHRRCCCGSAEGMDADADEEKTNCIYKHDIRKATTTQLDSFTDDLICDPTLARIPLEAGCPNILANGEVCGHNQAVAFLGKTGSETKIPVIYMCTNVQCCFRWEAN